MPYAHFREIRDLDFFKTMSDESFERLTKVAYVQNFPPQVQLIDAGDAPDFLHIIISGAVELFASLQNRESSMAILRPISTFILAATVKDLPYLMSARTLEKSLIMLIPSQDVRHIFATDPAFAGAVVTELARSYRAVIMNNQNLRLRNSQERLANYLLSAAQNDKSTISLSLEKRKLASVLNMTPENLSRAFKNLTQHGVEMSGNQITISDRAALTQLAKPSPLIDDPAI